MEYSKHEIIGRLIEEELIRNRNFRRTVAVLPLGKEIAKVLASPDKSVTVNPTKWQLFVEKVKRIFKV